MKKKKYFTISLMLLAFSSAALADETLVVENPELQAQEQARDALQTQIDKNETPALVLAMQREQFRHTNMVRVQKIIEDAKTAGLPTKPLTDKVYEGIAKEVDEERIVQAVSRVRNRHMHAYQQARELAVDPEEEKPLGDLIAGAYTAGLGEEECDAIIVALQTRTRTMNRSQAQELTIQTMATARVMAHRDVRSETISDVMVSALDNSYKATDMKELQHAFINRARLGSSEDVAQLFSDGINQGLGSGELGHRSGRNEEYGEGNGTNGGSGGAGSGGSNSSGNSGGSSGGGSGGSSSGSGSSGDSSGGSNSGTGGAGTSSGGSGSGSESSGGNSNGSGGGAGSGRGK